MEFWLKPRTAHAGLRVHNDTDTDTDTAVVGASGCLQCKKLIILALLAVVVANVGSVSGQERSDYSSLLTYPCILHFVL